MTNPKVLARRCERACNAIRASGRWDASAAIALRWLLWLTVKKRIGGLDDVLSV